MINTLFNKTFKTPLQNSIGMHSYRVFHHIQPRKFSQNSFTNKDFFTYSLKFVFSSAKVVYLSVFYESFPNNKLLTHYH